MSARILVVGPNWVGDMVMAQSLFMTLTEKHPHCRLDVLAPAWTLPLLRHMPQVSAAIEIPLQRGELGLRARYRLGRKLRAHGYEQAYLLPNSLKSALIPFFAAIPQRIGYIGEQRWGLLTEPRRLHKERLPRTVQRFVALGLEADAAMPPDCPEPAMVVPDELLKAVTDRFLQGVRPARALGLCAGAEYGPAKQWPAEHYAAVANHQLDQGWAVWLFGSPRDREVCAGINQLTGNRCADFSGRTSLNEAIALLSLTRFVVTNDSGLMHVAAALNVPLAAVYGSSDPGFTPPLNAGARVLSLGLSCSPCFERVCPLGHTRCLYDLEPSRVLQQIPGA